MSKSNFFSLPVLLEVELERVTWPPTHVTESQYMLHNSINPAFVASPGRSFSLKSPCMQGLWNRALDSLCSTMKFPNRGVICSFVGQSQE